MAGNNLVDVRDTSRALDDAGEIQRIVRQMKTSFDDFNDIMRAYAGGKIKTQWADQVYQNWVKYNDNDIPSTLEDMLKSATNIQVQVAGVVAFSQERN